MFIHPQPPTTTHFQSADGYFRYMRLLSVAGMVMAKIKATLGACTGMHLEYDSEGNTVVKLYVLGLTPSDQKVSSQVSLALISSLDKDLVFVQYVRDEPQKADRYYFQDDQGTEEGTLDMRNANDIGDLAIAILRPLYDAAVLDTDKEPAVKTLKDGSFMKKVASVTDIGQSSNYVTNFDDGSAIRFTMPTHLGEQIKPGDWIYHTPTGGIERIPAQQVN